MKRIIKKYQYRNRILHIDIMNYSFMVTIKGKRQFVNEEDIKKFNYYIEQLKWEDV